MRWRKYGKDRLYVNAPDGTRIGWRDLRSGVDHLEPGAPAELYYSVVASWLDQHPAAQPSTAPEQPATVLAGEGAAAVAGPEVVTESGRGRGDARPSATSGDAPHQTAAPASGPELMGPPADAPPPAAPVANDDEDDLAELVAALVAAHESDVAPDVNTTDDLVVADDDWEDLAERLPGAAARAEALRLRRAKPVRTALARVLRVHTDERAWRIGADGEEKVAVRLVKLAKRDPRWRFLHAVPVGERGSDIDHLIIGPPGVFTINAKHHPGAKIWIGGDTFMVNGHRHPYVRNSRFEAKRAARLLSVATGLSVVAVGVVVPVGAAEIRVKKLPVDVKVVNRMRLVRWLESLPALLTPEHIEALYSAARRSTTWRPTA